MAIKKNSEAKETAYVIKVLQAKEFNGSYAFDMNVNGINIYNCWFKTFTRKDGSEFDSVSFPSHKGNDGKYYSYAWFKLTDEMISDIANQISSLL